MVTSEDILNEIKRMAAAMFSPKQIAFALGFDKELFINELKDENSKICQAYYSGFFACELAVRESVFLLARNASSPAQTLAIKMIEETRKKLRYDAGDEEEI